LLSPHAYVVALLVLIVPFFHAPTYNPQDEKICGAITPSTVVDKMLSSGDYVTRKKYKKVGL